jgi:hypothetical protein
MTTINRNAITLDIRLSSCLKSDDSQGKLNAIPKIAELFGDLYYEVGQRSQTYQSNLISDPLESGSPLPRAFLRNRLTVWMGMANPTPGPEIMVLIPMRRPLSSNIGPPE